MFFNYYIILLFTIATLWSCNPNSTINNGVNYNIIQVDQDNVGDFQIVIEKVIPLETSDESIFGEIYKVILKNDGFFVHDHIFTNNIYLFDEEGQYVSKLDIGKGPKEVVKVYSTFYDNKTKELYVNDPGTKNIKIFDNELSYKRTIPTNNIISYHHFSRLSNNKWIVATTYRNYPRNDTTARFVVMDSNFSHIEKKYLPFQLNFRSVSMIDPFDDNPKKEVLFCNVFDNNIYTLNNTNEINIKYQVDFGQFNLSSQEIQSSPENIVSLRTEGKRKTYLDNVSESEDYVGFSYLYEKEEEFCIYSKKSGKILSSEFLKAKDFILGMFVLVQDDHFVCAVEPSTVLKYLENPKNNHDPFSTYTIKVTDNPLLIFYRIKENLEE